MGADLRDRSPEVLRALQDDAAGPGTGCPADGGHAVGTGRDARRAPEPDAGHDRPRCRGPSRSRRRRWSPTGRNRTRWPGVVRALDDAVACGPGGRGGGAGPARRSARHGSDPRAARRRDADERIGGLHAAAAAPDAVDVREIRGLVRSSHAGSPRGRCASPCRCDLGVRRRIRGGPAGGARRSGSLGGQCRRTGLGHDSPGSTSAAAGPARRHGPRPRIRRDGTRAGCGAARAEVAGWALRQIDSCAGTATGRQCPARLTPSDELREFLVSTLERRILHLEERAVLAAAALGSPNAAGVLRRSLRAPDPDVRAQAIETLDSLVDRRLGRALAALLEDAPSRTHGGGRRGVGPFGAG